MITYLILEYHLEMLEEILSFFKSISLEILGDITILNDKNIASFLYTEKLVYLMLY